MAESDIGKICLEDEEAKTASISGIRRGLDFLFLAANFIMSGCTEGGNFCILKKKKLRLSF